MKITFRVIIAATLAVTIAGPAYADDGCARYKGKTITLPETDKQFLQSAIAMFKNKKRSELLAISVPKLQLRRRFLSGGVDARGGMLWVHLKPEQIDEDLKIHIGSMTLPSYFGHGNVHFGPQTLGEFSDEFFNPKVGDSAVSLDQSVCDGFKRCDTVPIFEELPQTVYDLLSCNGNSNGAFVFTDGLLLTNMNVELLKSPGLPLGQALFFSKVPSGYRLSVLISFQ